MFRKLAFCCSLLLFLEQGAFAEITTPGAVLQQNTQTWATPKGFKSNPIGPSNQVPSATPQSTPEPVELEKPPSPTAQNNNLKVFIRNIRVEGVTLISSVLVQETLKPYENRELSFAQIEELTEKLTDLYIHAGYVNSRIYVPPQDLKNNVLILRALEVKLGSLSLKNSHWFGKNAILPRIPLKPGDFLNIGSLERSIRLINDNPDLKITAQLKQGELPGTSDIVLQEKDAFPIHVTPFWDNLGRTNIGNFRYGLTTVDNNVSGFGDTDSASINFSRSSLGVFNQYALPVGPYGTQIGMDYAYSKLSLTDPATKPLDIHSTAQIFSPVIQQPLWKNDRFGLTTLLNFDFKNLNTQLLGSPFNQDRLRVLRPGWRGYWNDGWGRFAFNQEFGIGLPLLGGTSGNGPLASKLGAGSDFFRMAGGLTRVQKLPFGTTGVLRSNYQYSPDRLVAAEEFQSGGAFTVRGYTEGRYIGDSGYVLNAEWYVPAFIIPAKLRLPLMREPLRDTLQVVAFSDIGQVFTNRPVSGELARVTMAGCGFGLRLQLTRFLVGRIDLGFPLIHKAGTNDSPRVHFGLQSTLF